MPLAMLSLLDASCSPKPALQPALMLHSTGAAATQIKQGTTEDFTRKTGKTEKRKTIPEVVSFNVKIQVWSLFWQQNLGK